MWNIKIYNVGKEAQLFMVFGDDGMRRPAVFPDDITAMEACRVIVMLRMDSAFEGAQPCKVYKV